MSFGCWLEDRLKGPVKGKEQVRGEVSQEFAAMVQKRHEEGLRQFAEAVAQQEENGLRGTGMEATVVWGRADGFGYKRQSAEKQLDSGYIQDSQMVSKERAWI